MPLRLVFLIALCALTLDLSAQIYDATDDPASSDATDLRVALRIAPPFVIENPAGDWSGLSVDAFEEAANRLG